MLAILAVAATAGVAAAHSQQIEPIELRVADTFAPGHTFAQDGTPTWIEANVAAARGR